MYFLLGISLTLALLLLFNLTVAVSTSLIWKAAASSAENLSPKRRAAMIFVLRIVPVAAALTAVFAFVVPAYVLHEPAASGEVVSGKLALLAAVCLAGVIIATTRVLRTWLATRRLTRDWLTTSKPIHFEGVGFPLHLIEHPFPVLAVVGVFRPRIFVASKVFDSLSAVEFRVAVAHELGHLRERDNLKQMVLRLCRDLVIFPIGRDLDVAWAQTAEIVADEYAAARDRFRPLDLASALLKISRLVPAGTTPQLPVGAYIISDRAGDITRRIRHLLRLSDAGVIDDSAVKRVSYIPAFAFSLVAVLLLALHLFDQRLLLTTHEAIEHFVWMIS
ncbi:MAG: M56 family metallopeptidase [Pyrinomonadaceae bacterium]